MIAKRLLFEHPLSMSKLCLVSEVSVTSLLRPGLTGFEMTAVHYLFPRPRRIPQPIAIHLLGAKVQVLLLPAIGEFVSMTLYIVYPGHVVSFHSLSVFFL